MIERFEDIKAWQKARALTGEIYQVSGEKDFARGSSGETRSHLYVALDARLISEERFAQLREQTQEVSRLISGFMKYMGNTDW